MSVLMGKGMPQTWFRFLIVVLLMLGIFFRFFNLEGKVYWHDEVYTSMRAAGFTRQEIDRELFQNRIVAAPELQKYQRLKPRSTVKDTIDSLAIEDPQHPPLYFLTARFWMQVFGSSLIASRTLPAILSLLALPLMYGLALELFASQPIAVLATALLALSPFDVLFAQTARQYSLLASCVIGSSFLLLRALRLQTWRNWGLYALFAAIGLYTHPFFGLTIVAQVAYVLLNAPLQIQNLKLFPAIALSLILYSPWLVVMKSNYQRVSDTTSWTKTGGDLLYLVKLWILSFTALFLDLDFGFDSIWTYLLRLTVVLAIAAGIYTVCRRTSRATWLFILTSIFVPFIILALPDLLLGGKRSAVSRYLISCYPGVQLAVAYLLGTFILTGKQLLRSIFALLLTGAIASCTVSAFSDTWWCKDLSSFNPEVSRRINAAPSRLVISEIGDDFTNTGDLISMSYLLYNNVQLLLLSQTPNLDTLKGYSEAFVFRPSGKFRSAVARSQWQMEPIVPAGGLWQLKKKSPLL